MICEAIHPNNRKVTCRRVAGHQGTHAGQLPRRKIWIEWEDQPRFMSDRKSLLLTALENQDGQCFWCRYPIICVSEPHTLTILTQNPWTLSALINGERIIFGLASADHVIPQWLGGQTTERNIVAACKACNEDRGQMHNRSWFIVDVTGFDEWLDRQRNKRDKRYKKRSDYRIQRLGTSLRPLILKALSQAE